MDAHDDIADLEGEIDALAEAAERCRKIMAVAKATIAVGAITFVVAVLGLWRVDALLLLASVTGILAGIAIFGSHRSTLQELTSEIAAREARRLELIDAMDLRLVTDR